jgi:NAD(P)-dependent dehydrogenase (short-subunit alcohol dehydrogenase family)
VGVGADVAETIVWLLSDKSSFVNGAVIPVNGGHF